MYTKFFGLNENPFTTSPNPKYFFSGKSHEEALLHLQYSVSQGEGFTLITGEKGIGKTISCHTFVECQDDQIKSAFISYSKLNPKKLLKRISKEFDIKVKRETLKNHRFLMQKKTEGKRVVIFLDDAHKHDKDVLEQLRLLSNLETTRDKLLQIVLIGRPELTDMLNSHDLRSLSQRITINYHLQPLDRHETFQYIIHRIAIAGPGVTVKIDPSARRQIYNFSNGIPQLINTVCNRVLMASFKLGQKHVSGEIVKSVLKDLKRNPIYLSELFKTISRIKLYGFLSILILVAGFLVLDKFRETTVEINPEPVRSKIPKALPNNQIQKSQTPSVGNISHNNQDTVKLYDYKQPKNLKSEIRNGRSDNLNKEITYSIQVGAYLVLNNANYMMNRLNEKGYAARIVNFDDNEGRIWHTVRIGNYSTIELAKGDVEILISEYGIKAVVLPSNKF
jgi:general secretion pathway protein A